jgi:hypothetical protein
VFVIALVPIPKLPEAGLNTNFWGDVKTVDICPLVFGENVGNVIISFMFSLTAILFSPIGP